LPSPHPRPLVSAVLLSGGLDSAVLLAEEAARHQDLVPVYVSVGLAWESAERDAIQLLLASLFPPSNGRLGRAVRPLVRLTLDMSDVYPAAHWAMIGRPPGYHTPDEAVYLPGRNIVLLGKTAVFCAAAGVERIAMGTLGHNPFPDATPGFRTAMAAALSLGLDHSLQIDAPYADLGKAEVIRRGLTLGVPFELTLSCLNPVARPHEGPAPAMAQHCGLCSKCRERRDAFAAAGVSDPSTYANPSPR
jgi:7-cyano-7-deazaguanine synthase